MNSIKPNRLVETTSPYLQQHAYNPVDWWPWCEEALELARRENKPILLSIGYSACHWCHVMAHESFEDEKTAALMNKLFVNIKVDREERPDLDKIYQNAHYLLSQRNGGWPLTIFLTADEQMPFFSGTYFPPEPRHGLPALKGLIENVAKAYYEQVDAIREQNISLRQALIRLTAGDAPTEDRMDASPLSAASKTLKQQFDARHGGFGTAPKFPHPDNLALLLHTGSEDQRALYCACFTLEKMALGGINDQLGGGFCRYSVDAYWMIPHFEKMLYDNGPLLGLYADAWRITAEPLFETACHRTAGWVMAEMQSPEGGYYSSLDADSEGEEGKFYVWSKEKVQQALSEKEYAVFSRCYGLDDKPNFEGKWHLHNYVSIAVIGKDLGLKQDEAEQHLESARQKLLVLRSKRIRPGRDEKILSAWNALMIRGMTRAGRTLSRPDWVDSAAQALNFIRRELWHNGRLLAVHKDGVSHQSAYLDDHVMLIHALLEMLQTRWNTDHLQWALELANVLLEHFEDKAVGGFYFTADDHEQLIQRPKIFTDDAMPSGNGIAAQVLLELSHLTGDIGYHEAAEKTLKAAWNGICQAPHAHASLLLALDTYLTPGDLLIIRAQPRCFAEWRHAAEQKINLKRSTYLIPAGEHNLPKLLTRHQSPDEGSAWLCRGFECLPPVASPEALAAMISE